MGLTTEVKITVIGERPVFLLEDHPYRIGWFHDRLGGTIEVFTSGYLAIARLNVLRSDCILQGYYSAFFLDHDLGSIEQSGGEDVARVMQTLGLQGHDTIVHSWNPGGSLKICEYLPMAVRIPFGGFEVERRIEAWNCQDVNLISIEGR